MVAILMVSLFLLILLSVPISFAIGFSSILVLGFDESLSLFTLAQRTFAGLDSFVILAIPLFLLTGNIMNYAGITDKLIEVSYALVGHIKGGLAHINVVVSMIFAGISGSSTADTAGIGSVLIPAMIKRGYSKEFTVAITAASSTIGQIIPPSILAVIYAATAGVSVGALFLAGIFPGVAIGLSQMAIAYYFAKKYNYPCEEGFSIKRGLKAIKGAILPMITPIIIIGGITGGIFTATEAAVIAVAYSLILAVFVYHSITMKKLWEIFVQTGVECSVTLLCIGIATVFGYILAYYHIPDTIGEFLKTFTTNHVMFLSLVMFIFFVAGTFMDATPSIIILVPIIYPISNSLGIHPIHLAVVVVTTMALGLVTPPYGLCLLLASHIAEIPMHKVFKTMLVFVVTIAIIILLIVLFPDVTLFIPRVITPKFM
ncbi:TRAP transporter large permease [Petroclostridium sp. X23]|uniref:TRAP transporter large permease n=1 Tax=Petroclostridium sp. X23 TaxID=3045146 RepID=UPI0024AD9CE3|nr:TRAP transporter large permease [Petroclostridium sp. X23]WHH59004.1 TRAP transporter large permease [Petroclostridium sp. X23]